MAEKVQDLPRENGFNAAMYSDRLQETRTASGALPAVQVFDKTQPDSIVPFVRYVREAVYSRVQALIDFTAAHEVRLNAQASRLNVVDTRLDNLESQRSPFGSVSG